MIYIYIAVAALLVISFLLYKFVYKSESWVKKRAVKKAKKEKEIENKNAQKLLDQYLQASLNGVEIGKLYERYIGYLYESEGAEVKYNGAVASFSDFGRDLIVKTEEGIHIVQTKRWASFKKIHEKHIFQIYGSAMHYLIDSNITNTVVKPVFYTSATYTDSAREVAEVLGVELYQVPLDKSFPMIKCNVSKSGQKIYHLPIDPYYDKIKIKIENGDCFVFTVSEAVAKGFRRARNYKYAA